jgi:hypothetical protein
MGDFDRSNQYDMARGDVVIPNEPALIAIISLELGILMECFSYQFHKECPGSRINLPP